LTRRDQPLPRVHLLRLDQLSRYERFGMAVNDAFLAAYAAAALCFDGGDLVFGYFSDGVLPGAAELRSLGQRREMKRRSRPSASKGAGAEKASAPRFWKSLSKRRARSARKHFISLA
jgi:hypothetical protein